MARDMGMEGPEPCRRRPGQAEGTGGVGRRERGDEGAESKWTDGSIDLPMTDSARHEGTSGRRDSVGAAESSKHVESR